MGDNVRKGGLLPATCLISQHLPAADPNGPASPNSKRTWQSKLNSDCKLSWCGDSMHSSLVHLTKKQNKQTKNCLTKWVQESRLSSPTGWLISLQELFLQQIVRPFHAGTQASCTLAGGRQNKMMRMRDKSVAFFALFTVMCCIGRGMKVEHYPIYRVAKCPRQHTWNWPTALNHLIVGCTSISRGGHSFIFFSQFDFLYWMLGVRTGQIQCSLLCLWLWGLSPEVETDSSAMKSVKVQRESGKTSQKRGQLIGSLRKSLLSKNVGFLWAHNDVAVSLWEGGISPSAWSDLYFLNL